MNETALLYELWLQDACSYNPKKVQKCIFTFHNAYNVFHSEPYSIDKIKLFGFGNLLHKPDIYNAERILRECREKDIKIITIDDDEYPSLLKEIYLPPRVLYVKGSLKGINERFPVSIVGARKSTSQGNMFTSKLSKELSEKCNCVIVSGMAEGIDRQAHSGAINAKSKTVAVLAGGVDIIYPLSNKKLYYDIIENGAVISEMPPGVVGTKYSYVQRNRLIAGFSRCSIIVEGTLKSGARHTASHALDNNRDVFTVPSNPMQPQSQLPNSLIKSGAGIVVSADDIIEQYIDVYPEYFRLKENRNTEINDKKSIYSDLSGDERRIAEYIYQKGGICSAEELAEQIEIPIGKLNSILTILCIKDVLAQQSQNEYLLKEV